MTNRSTYTLAVRDHQFDDEAHDVVTFDLECDILAGRGSVDLDALDAALATVRAEVIKAARFYAEIAARDAGVA